MNDEERALFLNRVRSLYNIDMYLLPELSREDWDLFRTDPARFMINTDATQAKAICREVERRQRKVPA